MSRSLLLWSCSLCLTAASCASDSDDGNPSNQVVPPTTAGSAGTSAAGAPGTINVGGSVGTAGNTTGGGGSSGAAGATTGSGGVGQAGAAGAGGNTGGSGGVSQGGATGSAGGGGMAGVSATGCDAIEAVYCNDFEADTVGMAPAGDFSVDNDIIVESAMAYSGTKAVRVTADPPGNDQWIRFTAQQFPNNFHGRVMVNMTKKPQNNSHWDIIILRGGNRDWELGGMFGNFELVVDPPDDGIDSDTEFPEGSWFCLQWQFNYVPGGDNVYYAKLDGEDIDPGEISGRWEAGAWESLRLGFVSYQGTDNDVEVWYDDLAFGDAEIPCPE